jgi:hypothetical protein
MLEDLFDEDLRRDEPGETSGGLEKLGELARLVKKMRDLGQGIEKQEEALNRIREEYRQLNETVIPDLFDELQLSVVKLDSGEKVEVVRDYATSITEKNQPVAFGWLKKNGHDSIIKHVVAVTMKKGEQDKYKQIISALGKVGVAFTDKKAVHPQTLKAFVKELITTGVDFPQEAFGVFPIRKTKVK